MTEFALTILQPYASLVMAGTKPVENRGWPPPSTLPQWGRCTKPRHGLWHDRRLTPGEWSQQRGTPDWDDGQQDYVCQLHGVIECQQCPCGCDITPDGPFPFRLWIHAGKARDVEAPADAWQLADLATVSLHRRVYGVVLGSVQVTGCHHARECTRLRLRDHGDHGSNLVHATMVEAPCSPWAEPDVYHWLLADPQPLPEPVPAKGRQKLWRLDADTLAAIRKQGVAA